MAESCCIIFPSTDIRAEPGDSVSITIDAPSPILCNSRGRRDGTPKLLEKVLARGCISAKLSDRRRVQKSCTLAPRSICQKGDLLPSTFHSLFFFFFFSSAVWLFRYLSRFFLRPSPPSGLHQRLSFSPRRRVDENKSD